MDAPARWRALQGHGHAGAALLHRAFKERNHTVKVANGLLALKGVSRRQKGRALLELEGMGLIKVEHRGRKSPGITLLYPGVEP
jgi:hypothetical protein